MDERYIATVDLGTGKIALTVARIYGESTEVIFYKETASDGIRRSQVFNPKRAAAPLKALIKEAEDELGIKILQVVIGLPRYSVRQETAPARMERDGATCISQEEIDAVKSLALDTYPLEDPDKEMIYGAVTQSFSTEDMINLPEEDVTGMTSDVLEGNFKIFVGAKKAINNIDIMLNDAGVAPARKFFLPNATADAILSYEEKENGVALIEIGAGVTSLSIYQGGILRHYTAIPFGGKVITTDIKYVCGFKEVLAENIKMAYGACMPDRLQSMSEKIIQVNFDEDGTSRQIEVKYLSEIITARACEIIEAMLFKIQESGYAGKIRSGIVLTGGGANLTGLGNYVREMSGYNVRTGYPRSKAITTSGYPGISETSAAASIGLLLLAKDDTHLNCTTEPAPAGAEASGIGPVQAEVPESGTEEAEETVFSPVSEQRIKEKAEKERKPQKSNRGSFIKLEWGHKIVDRVGSLFDTME